MFADLELSQRLEQTEGSAGAAFVEARGGDAEWKRIGGAFVMFDGIDSPLTQTFGLGLFQEADEAVLLEVEEFFQSRGASVDHEVSPLAGVSLLQILTARGYAPFELSTVLFLDLTQQRINPALNPNLSIRIAKPPDAEQYARASAQGWDAHNLEIEQMGRIMFAARGYVGFIVENKAAVIATAGLVIHERVALLAGASTLPDARGAGAQRAVLDARLIYATEAGCDLAMIVTAPGSASQRNSERNGFRVAYTRTKWRLSH